MTDILQSLREDNDTLRAQLRECKEANVRTNDAIADIANECAWFARRLKAALHVTTNATIEHLLRYDEYLASKSGLPYVEWLKDRQA